MRASRAKYLFATGILGCAVALAGDAAGTWLSHVPEKERLRPNPFAGDASAILAGQKMFQQHCATCHGKDADGKGKKPSLRSERVHNASEGELEWLLKNGSLRAGMPSWSRLPEQQRWQIVTFVKSLQ